MPNQNKKYEKTSVSVPHHRSFCYAQRSAQPLYKQIKFKRGAKSAVVTGKLLVLESQANYIIRIKSGQTLRARQIGGQRRPVLISIHEGTGGPVEKHVNNSLNNAIVKAAYGGDYRIYVSQSQERPDWIGTFRFKIWVE